MKKVYLFCSLFFLISVSAFSQNYTVLGNATSYNGCNCYQLTPDAQNQSGAIYQNNTINLTNSFDYTFQVFLGDHNGDNHHGADGETFVLTTNPNGLGQGGGGLGYGGGNQPCSVAWELDTWQNSQDPIADHIALESGGSVDHNIWPPVDALNGGGNIDNGVWHTVRITWDAATGTYTIYFDGVMRITYTDINFVADYLCGNPVVNWGWAAGTGAGTNQQIVCVQNVSSWVAGVNYQTCDLAVQFHDVSTSNGGNVQSWAWTFGDGGTSTQQNPIHTYAAAGTYNVTLTITDVSGCTNTYSHAVVINPPIAITPTLTQPQCNGGSDGSISTTVSGGFGPAAGYGGYKYNWNNNANVNPTWGGIGAGTYTLTVTDGVCTTTAQYTLNQPTPLTATISSTDANCGANNGTATVSVSGGTPPYSNTWWPSGQMNFNATGLAPATYTAAFHDFNGCSALLTYTTTVGSLPCGYQLSSSHTDVKCYGDQNGSATLTVVPPVGVTGITINWTGPNGYVGSGATISNLAAGSYNYTYHDGNNQTFTGTIIVAQPPYAMVVSLQTFDNSCGNLFDGKAIARVDSGGRQPYIYVWSGGQPNNPVANNLPPGGITVTVTDSLGCTGTANGTIGSPAPLTVSTTAVDDSCYQSHKGSANAVPAGGTPPYTFFWSNISSAQTDLSLGAGSYIVTVTDSRQCTATSTANINEPTQVTHTITHTDVSCYGNATGTITVTPSGGTPGYTYTWNPSTASGANPTGLTAGQYNVTVMDAHSCPNYDSAVITQPAQALNVVTSHTDVTCYGANNGSLSLTISGGTSPYTLTYLGNTQPVPGSYTLPGLPPNTYNAVVTDVKGCTFNVSETILSPAQQYIDTSAVAEICNGGSTGSATANFVNATGTAHYVWSNTATTATITNVTANTYYVTATDANNCTLTASITVTEPPAPIMTVTAVDALCYGANGSATANPTGAGPYTYNWSYGSQTTQTIPVPQGNYTVSAVDPNQCRQTASFVINQPPAIAVQITQTNIQCFGDNTGSFSLNVSGGTGSPNYTFTWNPNTITGNSGTALPANTYNVTITDQASCTLDTFVTLTQPASALSASTTHTDVTCFGLNNGTVTVNASGGTIPYSYNWSPNVTTGSVGNSLQPNTYDITITDNNGCTLTQTAIVVEPAAALAATETHVNLTCYGDGSGSAIITATGGTLPYTYGWPSGNSQLNSASNLSAGPYTVIVTDSNLCSVSVSFTLTQPAQLTASTTPVNEKCHGDAIGSIAVSATGGTLPYTYTWNPNVSTSNSATGLTAGPYFITVTDSSSCTAITSATVTEPNAITIIAIPTAALCKGQSSGSINAQAGGGSGGYNYTATSGAYNQNNSTGQFTGLAAGVYAIHITDQNQCATDTNITVTEPAGVSDTITAINPSCHGFTDGKMIVTAMGGTPGYSFVFSNNAANNTGTINNLAAGTYAVTITDASGCPYSDSATLVEPDSITFDVVPDTAEVQLGESIALTTTTNQTGLLTYQWTPFLGLSCYDCPNPTFNGVHSETYTAIITNEFGCSATSRLVVTVTPSYTVFIPNVISPAGTDPDNAYFQIFGNKPTIKQLEVGVFDRIGEKVFESNDINFKWDGTFKGKPAPIGVYTYYIKIVWLDDKTDKIFKGTVTILR